jgi:hypothetical protein
MRGLALEGCRLLRGGRKENFFFEKKEAKNFWDFRTVLSQPARLND